MEIYGKRLCPLNLTQDVFKLDCKQFLCYSWTCDIVKTLFVRCLCWRWRLLIAGTKLHLVSERWKLRILRQMRWSLPQTWGDPFFRELYKLCFVYSWQSCGFKERLRLQSRMVSLLIHDGKLFNSRSHHSKHFLASTTTLVLCSTADMTIYVSLILKFLQLAMFGVL